MFTNPHFTLLRTGLALVALAAATACGGASTTDPIPAPRMVFGEDLCAECSMIINEQRFAGAIGLRVRGRVRHLLFDDIGEMFAHDLPEHDEARYFVHDMTSAELIDATDAHFLRAKSLRTPMATGVAAFRSASERDSALAEHPGERLTLGELVGGPPVVPGTEHLSEDP
jgi:nitrous oxide reductase accessory protein NosL